MQDNLQIQCGIVGFKFIRMLAGALCVGASAFAASGAGAAGAAGAFGASCADTRPAHAAQARAMRSLFMFVSFLFPVIL